MNKKENGPHLIASLETFDGAGKKPFKATGLLNKSQLKLASYIKAHNDVTLHGTKRFTDKSGEYYLKNIQMQNRRQDPNTTSKKNSLNNPQYLENCVNSANLGKIRRRASKIVTLLPENSLTPIPKKDGINRLGMANGYGKKELKNAERTAVFIRRMEYSTSMKRQMEGGKNMKNKAKKIQLIQEWWKTMFKIIRLQKNVRGFLFRKKLMNNLEHQEKLLQFITEFDNIHNYHLFRNFMDNLKKKRDYEKAKLMEKCEDFNEKLDNLEKMRDMKNFRDCFNKWRDAALNTRKADYEKLTKKLNDILRNKLRKNNLETLKTIRDVGKTEDDKLDDKVKEFQERMGKNDFMKKLIRAHRLNKFLNNAKNKIDDRLKKEALDKLKNNNNIARATEKLQKLLDDNMKRKAWNDMKTMDFVNKLDDLMNKHNNKFNNDAKKEFLDKLKELNDKNRLREKLKKWKNLNDGQNRINKIANKLRRYKQNELRRKAEEDKNKLCVSSGVNDFELISDKKPEPKKHRNSQIFISMPNDINIEAKPKEVSESTGPNFSLIAPEKTNFEFNPPVETMKKPNLDKAKEQFDDIDAFKNKNDLKKYYDKWKDLANKKDIMDKLKDKLNDLYSKKKDDDIAKAAKKLDDLLNLKTKKDIFDTLKKTAGDTQGFKVLDKLFKDKGNDLKKEALNKLKKNADSLKALEDLDKLLNQKLKKKLLDNLRTNKNEKDAIDKLGKVLQDNLKKRLMNELKKRNNVYKSVQTLDKLMNDKRKKDALDDLSHRYKVGKFTDKLEKLIMDKLKKKFLDRLKNNDKLGNACNKLERLLNNKLKRDALNLLKNNNNIEKAANKLGKLINGKLKKNAFDKLKKMNDIAKAVEKLDKLIKNKLKDDTLKKLKTMQFVDILDKMMKNHNDKDKKDKLNNLMNNLKKLSNDGKEKDKDDLRKAFNHWKNLKELKDILKNTLKNKALDNAKSTPNKKRISRRKRMRKNRNDDKDDDDLELLREAFNVWRENSSFRPKREVLDKIKKNRQNKFDKLDNNKKNDLLEKYKHKMMQVLLNIYTRHNNLLLKKYLDKWRKGPRINGEIADEPKYKKKPRIEGKRDFIDSEIESFRPSYYDPKQNLYNSRKNRYKKRYIPKEEFNYDDIEKDQVSDTSSNCESALGNGVYLTQVKKTIANARNYTSQSFFIDKNISNPLKNNYQINTHNTNQLPMTMKGDFLSLIEKNPKILRQKNPRIQVTNSTCDLNQILNNETTEDELNSEEVNYEMEKLSNNFIIDKSKVLTKVIKNCDKDLYAAQRPFKVKKDQWYSVSIPLNNNEAKWEFLNNIKGERDRNNLNKFELIQNEDEPPKEVKENEDVNPYSTKTFRSDRKKSAIKDNSYRLREMNFTQYYRSPIKTPRAGGENEKSLFSNRINRVKRSDRKDYTRPFLNSYSRNWRNRNNFGSNNIDRSRGKIELDPKFRSIDFGSGDYEDSYE